MDPVILARIQFAITVGFHFIFPPISIGLAWLIVFMEWKGWRKADEVYVSMGKFFGKLLAVTFAVGVATGITMEFQFGTNWAAYSRFVGDIFGAPLAAEGVFAFFLESSFLGLYLFGRGRVSKAVHWFSILMVAVGASISAFWILVANSWQQTPAGYRIENGRAVLTSFVDAVFNASTGVRYFHTMTSALVMGAFFVMGVAAILLLRKQHLEVARRALKIGLVTGFVSSLVMLFPSGDMHAKQVARTQPAKLAAFEGVFETTARAPLHAFGIPLSDPPRIVAGISVPGALSWLSFGDASATVRGLNEFPVDQRPPFALVFTSFHLMVMLGGALIGVTFLGLFLLWRKRAEMPLFLKLLVLCTPLPLVAIQVGWITAEVGRQPWIVYNELRTRDAISTSVPAGQILFSIIMFSTIYALLLALYLFLLARKVKHGPDPVGEPAAAAAQAGEVA